MTIKFRYYVFLCAFLFVTPLRSYCAIVLPDEIRIEREGILASGNALQVEKNTALDQNTDYSTLSPAYNMRVMALIQRIINHYRQYEERVDIPLGTKQILAKKDLSNLAVSSALLTSEIINPYDSTQGGFENSNFWSDLRYLNKFNLMAPDPRHIPKFPMNAPQAKALMDSEFIDLLDTTCNVERLSFNSRRYGHVDGFLALADAHRLTYADHRRLVGLYDFATPQKDLELLRRAVSSITTVLGLGFGPPLTLEQLSINKASLFRSLIIVGEAATKKNLSPYTKGRCGHLIYAPDNGDWQDLIRIRNKIAHTEWDIHSKNFEAYRDTHDGSELLPSLNYLQTTFNYLIGILEGFSAEERGAHYRGELPAVPGMPAGLAGNLVPIQTLLGALPHTQNIGNNNRNHHPESFTPAAMLNRIDFEELPALERIFNIQGREALADPHPEDTSGVTEGGANTILTIMLQLNQLPGGGTRYGGDDRLLNAVQRINNYHVLRPPLILELPHGLLHHFPQNVGVEGVAELNFNTAILTEHLNLNFNDYSRAIDKYGRHCLLGRSLVLEPQRIEAGLFHFGRIGKFLGEIPANPVLGNMTPAEYRAFRNFIQHDDELVDTASLKPHDFLIRYTSMLIHEVMPMLRNHFLPVYGPAPN